MTYSHSGSTTAHPINVTDTNSGSTTALPFGVAGADSVAYSHADWERQQQAESTCHAARRYITIGRPSALTAGFLSCYPSHNQPPFADWCGAAQALSEPQGAFFCTGLEPHARSVSPATATRRSPREPAFGTRATMACGGLKKSVRVRRRMGVPGPNFGRSGAVQAPSFPGALHDLRGGRARFLVPTGSRS